MKHKQLLFFLVLSSVGNAFSADKPSAPWVGADFQGRPCTGSPQGLAVYDYIKRTPADSTQLVLSEKAHFNSEVEGLIRGVGGGNIASDLDYVLMAWPNHHRALLSLSRYQLRVNSKLPGENSLRTPPECYFQRALNFSPKDAVTMSLYGFFLRKTKHLEDASHLYEEAIKLTPNNSKTEYAYSLLLIDLKQYDKAYLYAKQAYQHGTPPEGLKNKLIKLGVWK